MPRSVLHVHRKNGHVPVSAVFTCSIHDMTFHTRNAYYLRISSNCVLPLYVRGFYRLSSLYDLDNLDNISLSYTLTINM
jgi:hypothetical protein